MSYVLPILFASIAVITFVVVLAFFPISVTWFYDRNHKKDRPHTSKRKTIPPSEVKIAPSMKTYRTMRDEDDFDDKEL